jgi:hypothetical protein
VYPPGEQVLVVGVLAQRGVGGDVQGADVAALVFVPADLVHGLVHAVGDDVAGRRHPAGAAEGVRGLDPVEEHPDLGKEAGQADRVAAGDHAAVRAPGAGQPLRGGAVQVVVVRVRAVHEDAAALRAVSSHALYRRLPRGSAGAPAPDCAVSRLPRP